MTAPPLPFGQTVAFAQRALTAVLTDHLAEAGTVPQTWYTLNTIATRGPAVERDALLAEVAQAPGAAGDELLDRLAAEGLIRTDNGSVSLTADGEVRHGELRTSIAGLTAKVLSPFPLDDIERTTRTLRAVTERAESV